MNRLGRTIATSDEVPADRVLRVKITSERRRCLEAAKEEALAILTQRSVVRGHNGTGPEDVSS